MNDIVLVVTLILILLLAAFFLPQLMTSRAIVQVIKIFKKHNAINIKNAKTLQELGLEKKSIWQQMGTFRDYKPRALQVLVNANIIGMTQEEKFYLNEAVFLTSRFSNI